jgi:uncharacterized membrane protein
VQQRRCNSLLCLWTAIGGILRFTQLSAKPPWTDEFATVVFSLGNDFNKVPLDRPISLDTLLQPLQPNPDASLWDVVSLLLQEDNHPPLYFVFVHLWMKLFPTAGEYVNFWVARSLPAIFGILSIPAIYLLAKITFNSRAIAHLSAALMAVSPYGIFIAQEARHYTLAILFVIASFGCFLLAVKSLWTQKLLPIRLIFFWIVVNSLGLSTHYFFGLTLLAEAIALAVLQLSLLPRANSKNYWRLGGVVLGAIATAAFWFVLTPKDYGNGMTDWIGSQNRSFLALISPLFQLTATWITTISLLPVEASSLPVVIVSGIALLMFLIWFLFLLKEGIQNIWNERKYYITLRAAIAFLMAIVFLFLVLSYGFGIDITRGARYSFTYFSVALVVIASALSSLKFDFSSARKLLSDRNFKSLLLVFAIAFLSAITVCFNLGYQKYYRPDTLVNTIEQKSSQVPVAIATTHKSLVQTGELMGVAWEIKQKSFSNRISFLLVSKSTNCLQETSINLAEKFAKIPKPLDVWTLNFKTPFLLKNCRVDSEALPSIDGYNYQLFHC